MNIDWRLKSSLFRLVDTFALRRMLYFVQKHVTGRAQVNIREIQGNWLTHRNNLQSLGAARVLEFGAGQNLAQNVYLSQFVGSQVLVDLFPMLDIELVNTAARQLATLEPSLRYAPIEGIDDLSARYSITYMAPLDLRASSFADGAFDACISTNTLEHIPASDIVKIFTELGRVVRHDGLISAVIDYSDHYAHTDARIGPLNYLQYSTAEFAKYNHSVHYQNRLRHYDYLQIFKDLGYAIVEDQALDYATPPGAISADFDSSHPTLCATRGIFLLRNQR